MVSAHNIAQLSLRIKDYSQARKYFDFVLRHFSQNQQDYHAQEHRLLSLLGLVRVYAQAGDFNKAYDNLKLCQEMIESTEGFSRYEQHYLQEAISLEQKTNHHAQDRIQDLTGRLLSIRTTPFFNERDYEIWQDEDVKRVSKI